MWPLLNCFEDPKRQSARLPAPSSRRGAPCTVPWEAPRQDAGARWVLRSQTRQGAPCRSGIALGVPGMS